MKIWKAVYKTVLILLLFVVVLIFALYIPVVQDFLVPQVLSLVNSEEMSIEVDHFRLSFPLDVDVKGLEIMQKGDTMLIADEVKVQVSPLPLLGGEVKAGDIAVREAFFKSGSPDSATYIRANIHEAQLINALVGLSSQSVDVDAITLRGGDIKIALRTDTTPPTPPTATYWKINGKKIALDNIDFRMTMADTGDDISASLQNFALVDGIVDLGTHNVNIDDVVIDGVDAKYLVGNKIAPPVPVYPDTISSDTVPWTIQVNHLLLDNSKALYALQGVKPQPGLDMQYIDVTRLKVEVDSFYNQGATMRVPLKELSAAERCGLKLYGNGLFAMNETEIDAEDFVLKTLASEFDIDATYGLTSSDAPLSANITAKIDPVDVVTAFPDLATTVDMLPKYRKLDVTVEADGNMSDLKVKQVVLAMRNYFDVKLSGNVKNITDFANADGHLDIDGDFEDINFIKPTIMDAKLGRTTHLPSLQLDGNIDMSGGVIGGDITATTAEGDLALQGKWNSRVEGYEIDLDTDKFPVGTFLPGSGIGSVSAKVTARGQGFDPMSPRTNINASVDAINVMYHGNSIHDLKLVADVSDGNAVVDLTSTNKVIEGNLHASGNLAGKEYDWSMIGDFKNIDLEALGVMDTVSNISTSLAGNMKMSTVNKDIAADLEIHSLDAKLGDTRIMAKDFDVDFLSNDSLSEAHIENQDLKVKFVSPMMLDSITSRFTNAMSLITPMVDAYDINVDALQKALPPFLLTVDAGQRNAVSDFLAASGTTFKHATLLASNDTLIRITASVDSLVTGSTRLDRIDFDALQEGNRLNYELKIDNEPGTFDDFAHIAGKGYIGGDKVMVDLRQRNIKDQTGYKIGALVELSDSTLRLQFDPDNPVIGYKPWTINKDNYISVNTHTFHLDANLLMEDDESRLHIYTNHDEANDHQEVINVDIDKILIQEWIALSPSAPPVSGAVSANMKFALSPGTINGDGTVTIDDLKYDKKRVGDIALDVDVTTSRSGAITANTAMRIDGEQVMTANGALNDTTLVHPFQLDFALTRLPLRIANPFVGSTATLGGYLSGNMDITGSMSEPLFNGYLDFDSATVKLSMLGTPFTFSEEKIPVDSNIIRFDNYGIYGVNDNPLAINGIIDMRSLSNINLDLRLKADNMQVVGNDKHRGTDVYGKAFISLDATAKGNMQFINARANLTVKEGTNVTYIIPEAGSSLSTQSAGDMVHFVNFADTAAVAKTDSIPPSGMMINLAAILNVEEGSTIGVDLSANGQDRVQINSNGILDFTLNPMGDTRTTGRLNLTGGFVRYTPPLMSEKLFDFQEGSYISFNGDMMNPTLHVIAIDVIKANVTQEGQNSRLVNFDVILKVNGTLDEMDVAFDLETDEDVTVRNELQSMSPEQRANQAMNLLLYNIYTGPGTKGNASLSGNPLYSFLSSTLNTWMANNVKGVDISFGIDQYERTTDGAQSTTTSYSYRVSKTFLDDRFKVVVGGNYSTDDDANQNLSQNLINDISFEYLLNKAGTMYVRLFRHTGYESILEGEVTQTGVGFVYKRKLRTLRNWFRKPKKEAPVLPQQGAVRIAGDILRKAIEEQKQNTPAGDNEKIEEQPLKSKEDETTVE